MAPLATFDINADTADYSEHSYECKASPKRPLAPSPPSGQTTFAKKSVSFNRRVILTKTIHITAYTADEVHACWYNGEEFYIMKTDARVTAQLIAEKSPVQLEDGAENVLWCTRGLESFVQETRALKRNTRNSSRWAVLDEQEMQHLTTRTVDSERLARVYMSASASALAQARALGLDDELELMTMI